MLDQGRSRLSPRISSLEMIKECTDEEFRVVLLAGVYWMSTKERESCIEITHRWSVDVPVRDERFIWKIDRHGFRYFEKISRRKR